MQANTSSAIITLNDNDLSTNRHDQLKEGEANENNSDNVAQSSSSLMTRLMRRGDCASALGFTMIATFAFIAIILTLIGYAVYVYGFNDGNWHFNTPHITLHSNDQHNKPLLRNLD